MRKEGLQAPGSRLQAKTALRGQERRRVLRAAARAKRLVQRLVPVAVAVDLHAREEHARKLASVCASLATGLEVYAKHTQDDEAKKLAGAYRDAALEALRVAQASRPAVRTCDRLRWEWLLSTNLFADEVKRLMGEASELARKSGVSISSAISWSLEPGAWSLAWTRAPQV